LAFMDLFFKTGSTCQKLNPVLSFMDSFFQQ
jgi:hypothetical protein